MYTSIYWYQYIIAFFVAILLLAGIWLLLETVVGASRKEALADAERMLIEKWEGMVSELEGSEKPLEIVTEGKSEGINIDSEYTPKSVVFKCEKCGGISVVKPEEVEKHKCPYCKEDEIDGKDKENEEEAR